MIKLNNIFAFCFYSATKQFKSSILMHCDKFNSNVMFSRNLQRNFEIDSQLSVFGQFDNVGQFHR